MHARLRRSAAARRDLSDRPTVLRTPSAAARRRDRRPARRRRRSGAARARGRHRLPRHRLRRARRRGRRPRGQHVPDRLPGDRHRPVVCRAGRGHDLPADRQLRPPRRRRPVRRARGSGASSSPTRRPRSSTTPASWRRSCGPTASRRSPAWTRARSRATSAPPGACAGSSRSPASRTRHEAVALARAVPRWEDQDFVAQVSPAAVREVGDDPAAPLVAIVDFGLKANIVNSLRRRGVRVRVLPHTAPPSDVLASDVAGVVLSPGPGDPARLDGPVALARTVIEDGRPLLGICLGHQIVGRAAGRRDQPPPLRAPRGQPPGPGPGHGLRPGDGPEPRGPGGGRQPPGGLRLPGVASSTSTTGPWRACATRRSRSRPSSTTRKAPRGRSTRSPCSTGSWTPAGGARDPTVSAR